MYIISSTHYYENNGCDEYIYDIRSQALIYSQKDFSGLIILIIINQQSEYILSMLTLFQ